MKDFLDSKILNDTIEETFLSADKAKSPKTSVIIVAYNPDKQLFERNIESLMTDVKTDYEIWVIDNSEQSKIKDYVSGLKINYIKLKRNYGLTAGRNVGIIHAKGEILIFLDDDAIPGTNFIDEHTKAHVENNICGLRGKCLPRTNATLNHFAYHYDLGDGMIPYCINLEGNSSFKKDILLEVGGFNSELKGAGGHEGLELSKKIIDKTNDKHSVIYWPDAIIYHDYSKSLLHYLKKQIRHQNHIKYMEDNHPDFLDFYRSYKPVIIKDERELSYITRAKIKLIKKINQHALRPNSVINRIVNHL